MIIVGHILEFIFLLFIAAVAIFWLYSIYVDYFTDKSMAKRMEASASLWIPMLEAGHILFQKHFKVSKICDSKVLASDIIEYCETSPISIVTKEREVLFLKNVPIEAANEWLKQHQVPKSERIDIWELILRPFLDTEFDKAEKLQDLETLKENGVPLAEVKKIRWKIGFLMHLTTWFSMEWEYYGQIHVLLPFNKWYWYTMDVALRNLPADKSVS